jgi:hypothetical protein
MDLQDNGDGTWSGRFVIPELHGQLLATHLQHLSSPRRMTRNLAGDPVIDRTVADATGNFHGLSWTESMGMALLELCEHLPTDGLAQHGRVGATVVIHLDHDRLLDGLAAAHLDSGGELSVSETRRLACGAGILPAVYAGRVCRSTSAASRGWTAKVNGSRCPGSTTAVPPKAASAR